MVAATIGYCMACGGIHALGDARDPSACDEERVLLELSGAFGRMLDEDAGRREETRKDLSPGAWLMK